MALEVTPPFPAPFQGTTTESYRGVPALIGLPDGMAEALRQSSRALETYSPELQLDLSETTVTDYGNLALQSTSPKETACEIGETCQAILTTSAVPVFLAETHTIAPATVRATLNCFPNLAVIQLSAHPNLCEEWLGDRWHEYCAMRRVLDYIPPENLVSLGVRSGSQADFREINNDLGSISGCPIYLSIDLSIIDEVFLPGLLHPVPGGLDWQRSRQLLDTLPWDRVKACDIVGLKGESTFAAQIIRDILLRLSK